MNDLIRTCKIKQKTITSFLIDDIQKLYFKKKELENYNRDDLTDKEKITKKKLEFDIRGMRDNVEFLKGVNYAYGIFIEMLKEKENGNQD